MPKSYLVTLCSTTKQGGKHRRSNNDPPPRHNGHRSNKSQKAFAGVSHFSKGSGATVGYLYLGIRAKGLMSVMSAHPMVKDATVASSDP